MAVAQESRNRMHAWKAIRPDGRQIDHPHPESRYPEMGHLGALPVKLLPRQDDAILLCWLEIFLSAESKSDRRREGGTDGLSIRLLERGDPQAGHLGPDIELCR
jgi:hypothetical protein